MPCGLGAQWHDILRYVCELLQGQRPWKKDSRLEREKKEATQEWTDSSGGDKEMQHVMALLEKKSHEIVIFFISST
jgi:hypothetical protein